MLFRKSKDAMPSTSTSTSNIVGNGGKEANASLNNVSPRLKSFLQFILKRGYAYRDKLFYDRIYFFCSTAAKMIDAPIIDMFSNERIIEGLKEKEHHDFFNALQKYQVDDHLRRCMIAARVYGGSVLLIVSKDNTPEMPLDIANFKQGDLIQFIPLSRYAISSQEIDNDIMSPTFGKSIYFNVTLPQGIALQLVHRSRLLFFSSIKYPTSDDNSINQMDTESDLFGISLIERALHNIAQDHEINTNIAFLIEIANLDIVKLRDLKEMMSGDFVSDEDLSYEKLLEEYARARDVYGVSVTDAEDSIERKSANFSGLANLIDRYREHVAGAADIPMSRFNGRAPSGLNASGDSELKNYAMMVESQREIQLKSKYNIIDKLLLANLGIKNEEFCFKFNPIVKPNELEKATIMQQSAASVIQLVNTGIISEEESREVLNATGVFGKLSEEIPEDLTKEENEQ